MIVVRYNMSLVLCFRAVSSSLRSNPCTKRGHIAGHRVSSAAFWFFRLSGLLRMTMKEIPQKKRF